MRSRYLPIRHPLVGSRHVTSAAQFSLAKKFTYLFSQAPDALSCDSWPWKNMLEEPTPESPIGLPFCVFFTNPCLTPLSDRHRYPRSDCPKTGSRCQASRTPHSVLHHPGVFLRPCHAEHHSENTAADLCLVSSSFAVITSAPLASLVLF